MSKRLGPVGLLIAGLASYGAAARKLWTATEADPTNILMTAYTIGNGKQAGRNIKLKRIGIYRLILNNSNAAWNSWP